MRFRLSRRGPLVLVVAALLAWEAWRILTPPPSLREGGRIVIVPPNQGVIAIARQLDDAGAIGSPEGFVALSVVRGTFRSLKAGEYEVPAEASTLRVLALIERGQVRRHPVLLPEGGTVAELARTIEATELAPASEVLRVASDAAFLHAHDVPGPSAEGWLFPDTYYFVRGMTAEQMLARMIQRMQAKLTPALRERAQARNLTLQQLLTLASIIEREAISPEERPTISAVFWNRLKLGMPLQADPTVQYAVGKERRTLTRADLAAESPYNTYAHAGLPPGPIASPGLSAIEAALEPAPVKFLYFVKKDDQHHHFSMTVEEHNLAVTRYRLVRTR